MNWEEWMVKLSKPFTRASLKYFNTADIDDARRWLHEGVQAATETNTE